MRLWTQPWPTGCLWRDSQKVQLNMSMASALIDFVHGINKTMHVHADNCESLGGEQLIDVLLTFAGRRKRVRHLDSTRVG